MIQAYSERFLDARSSGEDVRVAGEILFCKFLRRVFFLFETVLDGILDYSCITDDSGVTLLLPYVALASRETYRVVPRFLIRDQGLFWAYLGSYSIFSTLKSTRGLIVEPMGARQTLPLIVRRCRSLQVTLHF